MKRRLWAVVLNLLVSVSLLAGCKESVAEPVSLSLPDVFPGADTVPGWTPGDVEVFDSETIFNLVNGQADFFFVYGFEQVAVQRYEHAEGAMLGIEIWQVATPADAYGLFTASVAGDPVDVGNDGDGDPGYRLTFWQDRYCVHVRALQEIDDADLRSFAQTVSEALPSGGGRPALMDRLPSDRLIERSAIFFHEELSIQNELWLGGENLLGLSQDTDGVLGRYGIDEAVVRLLLVEYPDAESASAALAALEDSSSYIDSHLVAADVNGNSLGAVFGLVDEATASALLEEALR